ncbi:putative signal transduction histidine kinase, phosphotransfer (Hpt) domain-containing protein [Rosa chinensis]|uniref:Histidine-containing phosphotransfer protein n=1 Tax=Rosa chinensis TaxID=74649 RepID=A0A2P6RXE2_ROSCH|nr:histidine-containing phosphotransfer protein 4 [Rosa chinensis]PRQ51092.1 putative signal transduction histidine kinase, phosphotransfer (Hpt) domain-containing protein [Rosa chinensis]
MERNNIRRQVALMRQSLFTQGYLDEQFVQLEELQDDTNPNFVEEIATLYYRDSCRSLQTIEKSLEKTPHDFNKLDNHMHQFKGSSSSIGAKKVKAECQQFREYCRAGNGEGCMRTFQLLKKEHATLKKKLEAYFQMARQAGPIETASRPK